MSPTASPPYIGRQLDQDDSFRLLELQFGNSDEPITVFLLDARLNDAPSYEALSYVWGDASDVTPIQIADSSAPGCPKADMFVTVNCHAALKRLRKVHENRLLWVDAICINQSLIPERNHQLTLMARIYHCASRVIVYLGESANDSDSAIDWIREIDEPAEQPWLLKDSSRPLPPTDKSALQLLFQRPWFNRMWVLQEISLAKTAIVICGGQEVDWKSFHHFYHWNVSEKWLKEIPYSMKYQAYQEKNLVEFNGAFETRLLKMLVNARHCAATDPRDKLYGILPLLEWESQKEQDKSRDINEQTSQEDSPKVSQPSFTIKPDYALSTSQVYTDVATKLMQSFGLDLLQEAVNPPLVDDLPSWVPDWTVLAPQNDERKLYPTFLWTEFSAGSKQKKMPSWGRHFSSTRHRGNPTNPQPNWRVSNYIPLNREPTLQLHVRAVRVGKIQNLGDVCNVKEDQFPLEQWSNLSPNPEDYKSVPTPKGLSDQEKRLWFNGPDSLSPFLRTLTADDVVYPDVILDAIEMIHWYNGTGDPASRLQISGQSPVEEKMPLAKIFKGFPHSYKIQSQRILNTCDGKRFFATDTGFIGLATGIAKVGDDVFVLEGASAPFVFRGLGSEVSPDDRITGTGGFEGLLLSLLGQAYVQGIMHGEMWEEFGTRVEEIIVR
jgi:hypothetical protein